MAGQAKFLMLSYQLIAVVGILLVGLYISELMDEANESGAWFISRVVLAIFLYVFVIISLVPLWAFFSQWRSRRLGSIATRFLSVPFTLLVVSMVMLVAVDSVSFFIKQEDLALIGAFHVMSMLCAIAEVIFLMLRQRKAEADMTINSRVCDLLVMSVVCIYSALAVVDVVGSAYGYAHRLQKKLPEIIPISTLVLPLVVEFHRNVTRHWLKFNYEPGSHKRGEKICLPGEGVLIFLVAVLLMLVIAFLPGETGRCLFALISILIGSCIFYILFFLWHCERPHGGLYRNLSSHWIVITFDRVLLGITSTVTSVIFVVFACTQAENTMVIFTLIVLLITHIMQTFFVIWVMDTKRICSDWISLCRLCQLAMVLYNLYAFLLYAFYANDAYEASSSAGKVVIVVSFFVATSFWDLAIHWSEFQFVRSDEAQVIGEEHPEGIDDIDQSPTDVMHFAYEGTADTE